MTDAGNGQQNTQMAHSQNLGRREDYGGARPCVVDQVLHDLTHDMENIGIQGRESVQSDHVQRNPPTARSIPSLQRRTSLSRPTSLLGHGSRMGTISPIRTNSPVSPASRPTPFSRQQLEEHSRTYMSPVLENTRLPETIASRSSHDQRRYPSGQTVDQTLLSSPPKMQTVEGSINLPQPVHTTTRAHHSLTVQNRPTSRVERQSISRRSSSRRSRLTSRGPYPSPARNQSPVSYLSRHVRSPERSRHRHSPDRGRQGDTHEPRRRVCEQSPNSRHGHQHAHRHRNRHSDSSSRSPRRRHHHRHGHHSSSSSASPQRHHHHRGSIGNRTHRRRNRQSSSSPSPCGRHNSSSS